MLDWNSRQKRNVTPQDARYQLCAGMLFRNARRDHEKAGATDAILIHDKRRAFRNSIPPNT
jgi:hypothetical protein